MATPKKSWREKLDTTAEEQGLPKVIEINEKMSQKWGTGTCVIPAPREVDGVMRRVPRGKLTTINEIRAHLAHKHHASIG